MKNAIAAYLFFEYWPTFDIQIDITLSIFWEKLQSYTSWKANRSLSKQANIHINRATHYEITEKKLKISVCVCVFFLRLLFRNKKCWHFKFLMNQISGQRFIIFEKLRYRGQFLLKLRAVEVATSIH